MRKRKREERTLLRELGYKKYLKGARAESFPLCWLIIGNFVFGTGLPSSRDYLKKIEESLKATPVYCEETTDYVLIVLDEKELVIEDFAEDLEQNLNKKVKIIRVGDEKGLLVALYDAKNVFLGIGVLESIDYTRRFIRVCTSVRGDVAHLYLGQVKLDRKGREIGLNEVFPHYV